MDCQYTRYYKEPDEKYVCMSMALFLPEKYQKMTYGQQREIIQQKKTEFLTHIAHNLRLIMNNYFPVNYYYRIYYDDSIYNDEKFTKLFEILKNNHKYQLIKYKCSGVSLEKTNGHVGLFGTLLRLHPLFDEKSPNMIAVAMMDADNIYTREWVKNSIEFLKNGKYNLLTYQGLLESPFYKMDMKQSDNIDKMLDVMFFRAGMSIIKIDRTIFTPDIWEKYFENMYQQQDFMQEIRYLDFKKYAFFPQSTEQSFYSFEYGTDEIFLNFILKKLIKDGKIRFNIQYFINEQFKKFFYSRFTTFIEYNYRHNRHFCKIFLSKLAKNERSPKNDIYWFKSWINKTKNLIQLLNTLKLYQTDLQKLYIQTDFMTFINNPKLLNDELFNIKPYDHYLTTLNNMKTYNMY
jgi:hypothetical protein